MLLIMFQNAIYCRQTPIEVLHTILLGAEKYLLAKTMKSLSNENKAKVTARIESCDISKTLVLWLVVTLKYGHK